MALQYRHRNTDILQLSSGVSKWIISLCLSSRQLAVLILGSYVLLSLCFRLLNPLFFIQGNFILAQNLHMCISAALCLLVHPKMRSTRGLEI